MSNTNLLGQSWIEKEANFRSAVKLGKTGKEDDFINIILNFCNKTKFRNLAL